MSDAVVVRERDSFWPYELMPRRLLEFSYSLTLLRMDPDVASYFFTRCVLEVLDEVLLRSLLFLLRPRIGGFEHARCADVAIGRSSLLPPSAIEITRIAVVVDYIPSESKIPAICDSTA